MLRIIRDTAALFELEKQLQKVREFQLRAARDGRPPAAADLRDAEKKAVDQVRREYFCLAARLAFLPAEQAAALNDDQDYQARPNVDVELGIFDAHHRILTVPCVGDPRHDDPGPPLAAAEAPR